MKNPTLPLLLLAACQSIPTAAELDAQLSATALAFATAIENVDLATATELAAPSALGFFQAEAEFRALLWEQEPADPMPLAVESAQHEGGEGTAVVVIGEGENSRKMVLHFVRTGDRWGADGFARAEGEPWTLFADREEQVRRRLARAKAELAGHPELAPIVTAYLAAAAAEDRDAITKDMTDSCRAEELKNQRSFTNGFCSGRYSVARWQFSRGSVDGDTATQRVRTQLQRADGSTDGEPIRFEFTRTAAGWRISDIR
ncbi:MAG TPA: hypothetical protein ENI87_00580 [bacterium]|nr:hypothetical protein [bacterium]